MKVRRHLPPAPWSTLGGRRLVIQLGIVTGAALAGYLITVLWLFPAPFLSSDQSVPRVLELGMQQARDRLTGKKFRVRIEGEVPNNRTPRGGVVWQDPPPSMVLPEGTMILLTVSSGPKDVLIPDVAGLDGGLAQAVLTAGGFKVTAFDSIATPSERGVTLATRPPAGTARASGTPVTIVVSAGAASTPIPDLRGLTTQEARRALADAGLVMGRVTTKVSTDRAEGAVLEQRPAAGTLSPRDGRVDLIIARKPLP